VNKINRKILLTLLALVAVLLVAPYVSVVNAKPPTEVSGIAEVDPLNTFPLDVLPAGKSDNTIMKLQVTEEWTGDINGVGVSTDSRWVIHNFVPPAGGPDTWVNIYETLTFDDAEVLGQYGSLVMKVVINGGIGQWTILSGTDGLANLHGQGKLLLTTDPYSYIGQVHFAP